ncbi:DMT family transporter [bacterium]|nr:DMT family transporter [bacterium]
MRSGLWLALLTSLLWGITPLFDKLGSLKASAGAMMAVRFTTTFLCVLPLFLMPTYREEILNLDGRTLFYIVAGAVLSAIFGIFLYFMALKRMDASQVTPIAATYPLVTFVLSILILQEQFTWFKMLGTLLAVAGVVLICI